MREAKIRSSMPVKLLSSLLERRRKIRYCVATCLCLECMIRHTHSLRDPAFVQSKTHLLRSTSSG